MRGRPQRSHADSYMRILSVRSQAGGRGAGSGPGTGWGVRLWPLGFPGRGTEEEFVSGTRVTASGARSSRAAGAPSEPGDGRRPWAVYAVIIAATVLAVGLRLYDLSRPGYLFGISEYDDGTDFGSAVRLLHGAVPYRDFIMVQPPGITLIMFPVAAATKALGTDAGMAVGRGVSALASAAAVPLGGLLTRHRGLFAALVTCGVLAIYPDSILAARTVLLEPWLVLFCLLGALAVFDPDRVPPSPPPVFLRRPLFRFPPAVK